MTIGLILDDTLDKPDGVQQAVIAIGKELTKRGHTVHYIVSNTSRTDLPNVHSMGKSLNLKFNGNSVRTPLPVSSRTIKQIFKDIDFDVLHVQMPYSPLFASRVIKFASTDVKIIGTFHILPYGFLSKAGTHILGLILRKSLKKIDKFYAVSPPSLEFMEKAFKISGSVLPNPVDYNFFNSFTKKPSAQKNIVFVGRFEERKGVKELVEAYKLLSLDLRSKTKLTMCGKGPLLEEVKNYSSLNSLNIDFPGFVTEEQKAQYLANADIAVFPSKAGESFGIVLTESMSAGARVTIGGNNPGYASVLSRWKESLFNPSDTELFMMKLESFLVDESLANQIGASQHKAAKQYDIKTVVNELELAYSHKIVDN